MITYNLSRTPNQKFNTSINGHSFSFSIRTFRNMPYISVSIDGVQFQSGMKCIPNESLFGWTVNDIAGGEFRFIVIGDKYPSYEDFGGQSCVFAYIPFEYI